MLQAEVPGSRDLRQSEFRQETPVRDLSLAPCDPGTHIKSMLQNRGVSPGVGEGSRRSPLDGGQAGPLDQRTVSKPWISSHRRPLPSWEKRTAVPGTKPPAMT